MTTKAPSAVKAGPEGSLEAAAYRSVAGIPTAEPHDQDRLGYAVWLFLRYRRDPLDRAVRSAGARLLISEEEAVARIRAALGESGADTP